MIAAVLGVLVVALAVGAVTGRVRATSCCAPADTACDARMRAAGVGFGDGPEAPAP